MRKSLEDLDAKNKAIILLENKVKELEQKLQLADEKLLQKVSLCSSILSEPTPVVDKKLKKKQGNAQFKKIKNKIILLLSKR